MEKKTTLMDAVKAGLQLGCMLAIGHLTYEILIGTADGLVKTFNAKAQAPKEN